MDDKTREAILAMASGIEQVATAVRSLVAAGAGGCSAVREGFGDWNDFPCVLPVGHTSNHCDRDGDAF